MNQMLTGSQRRAAFLQGAASGCRLAAPLAIATCMMIALDERPHFAVRVGFAIACAALIAATTLYMWRVEGERLDQAAYGDAYAMRRFDPTIDTPGWVDGSHVGALVEDPEGNQTIIGSKSAWVVRGRIVHCPHCEAKGERSGS